MKAHIFVLTAALTTSLLPEEVRCEASRGHQELLERTVFWGFTQIEVLRRDVSVDQLSDGSGAPLNEDAFQIRNARLGFRTDWRHVGVSGEGELFGGVRPTAFEIHAQLASSKPDQPWIRWRTGLFPVPFGYEVYDETAFDRFFGERTLMSTGFVPGRFDLGTALDGHVGPLSWILAIQNGEPINGAAFAYKDPNAAKDIAARLIVRGGLLSRLEAAIGVSMLSGTGFSPGTQPTKDSFEWRDLNEDGRVVPAELTAIPGSAGRASQNFDRWGAEADAHLWIDIPWSGQMHIYGEVALAVNLDREIAPADPVLLGRDQRSAGFYAALVQHIGRHATAGIRYEQYEPNIDSLELAQGTSVVARKRFRTLSSGLSGELKLSESASARLLAEYEYQRNSLGRDNQGRPAQLDNDTFRVRVQVVF